MTQAVAESSIPALQPIDPTPYQTKIGLIGCGNISGAHLIAYKNAGYHIVALCDLDETAVRARQADFYPLATIYTDYHALLQQEDIEVVDITTHPAVRAGMIRDALLAGKHVLSQKPFVLDLAEGKELADLADRQGLKLAVNQNGRWAPHFRYMRQIVQSNVIGTVNDVQMSVNWNHNPQVVGTPYDKMHHLVLYDFAIHWFDMVASLMYPRPAREVFAQINFAADQQSAPPLLAQVVIRYDNAQASLVFNANTLHGAWDRTAVIGTNGTLLSGGPSLNEQSVTLYVSQGKASPPLSGNWFPDGFHGAMAELLRAVENDTQPETNAHDNLKSLALCFAAIASAESGQPVSPGTITRLPDEK